MYACDMTALPIPGTAGASHLPAAAAAKLVPSEAQRAAAAALVDALDGAGRL
jgi:ATP-dependent DNA helicase 2 subunit 2